MEQKYLCALLQLYRSNFQTIHWRIRGKAFDRVHGITNDYYEKVGKDLDDVAEILMRQDINPDNYFQVIATLKNGTPGSPIVNVTEQVYDAYKALDLCQKMLLGIMTAILDVLKSEPLKDIANVGIKSYFESLYDSYDKEARFLNKARLYE